MLPLPLRGSPRTHQKLSAGLGAVSWLDLLLQPLAGTHCDGKAQVTHPGSSPNPLRRPGQREAQHLPKASSSICLAEALGLRFKSLFIDSYKGESEPLPCLHPTKSIHIKGVTAELPLAAQPAKGTRCPQLLWAAQGCSLSPQAGSWPCTLKKQRWALVKLTTPSWLGSRGQGGGGERFLPSLSKTGVGPPRFIAFVA